MESIHHFPTLTKTSAFSQSHNEMDALIICLQILQIIRKNSNKLIFKFIKLRLSTTGVGLIKIRTEVLLNFGQALFSPEPVKEQEQEK